MSAARRGATWARTSGLPAYACAIANLAAVLALATVLAPGTTLAGDAARASYVRDHLIAWRLGWSAWIVAAISLLLFYAWWTAARRAGRLALGVALSGFVADVIAESMLIAAVPDRPDLARAAFFLTGAVANGCYTIAGIILSLQTPVLRGAVAVWTAVMWASGLALSLLAALDVPLGVAVSTAILFALFLPWLVIVGRRLA